MEPEILYPLQLLDVRLYTAALERLTPEAPAVEAGASRDATIPFLAVNVEILRHADRNLVSVFLTIETKGPDANRPEFHLCFTLEGMFEAQQDLDTIEEAIWNEFEHTSSITLLWPYAREYTHSFFRRMRVDLPMLPTLNRLAMHQTADAAPPAGDKN